MSDYIYLAQLSVSKDFEQQFNDFYDNRFLPLLLEVPGVNAAHRYRLEWTDGEKAPEYLTVYEVDSPDVPKSAAWLETSVKSGWVATVRPHFSVRRHAMFRRVR